MTDNPNERQWVKSHWSKDQLNNRTVEYVLPDNGMGRHGIGQFDVLQNTEGLLAMDIIEQVPTRKGEAEVRRYQLGQSAVDRIVEHPDKKVADFLLK